MPRSGSPLARLLQRPGFLGGALFVATMGLAGALAYQAAGAAASHRAAAEATLAHHATIAAWRFAREGRSWVGWGMGEAGNKLVQETMGTSLPGPELLSRVLADKDCDCMSAGFARTLFRVTPRARPNVLEFGEPLSERAKGTLAVLAESLTVDTARRANVPRQWLILPPGKPHLTRADDVVLLWKVGDQKRGVRAIYGMVVEAAQIERPLKGALDETQFFPASLVPDSLAASLVRFEVAGTNGATLFAAGPPSSYYTGRDTLGLAYGDMVVTAAIAPGAAPLLLAGGLPPSRVHTILALLALAIGLGLTALFLVRREERLVRLREDFVSGVSHELRTPLTQIRMLSELLQSDGFKSAPERMRATDVIHREAMRLTNLVDNILDFTRLRRAVASNGAAPVSLAEVAREVAESFAPLLDAQSNRLELSVSDDVRVAGDRDAVNRIMRNLLENAIKYGPRGQTIRLTVAPDERGCATITVDDEGPGIPPDEWSRIWQPYYRLDRDRNVSMGGSGLGLAVVADLTRVLGGRAWVSNAPNKGARFTVELPAAPRTADPSLRSG